MQIVLLCGGSGTRLWPLSNQIRSKQFIKFFKAPNGTAESMFQRVLRQLCESKLEADINIVTSQSQMDLVMSQSIDGVSIITEPYRRDTFPAIALASSYLSDIKNVPKDEIVVVMPCDVYADDEYFATISELSIAVESDLAELVLMGIEPSIASSKFGYIIPSEQDSNTVEHFIEKPDFCTAAKLIEQGALWNGGVFAFKLGYLLDIVSKYAPYNDYDVIREHYEVFPKISFDYEVVEKAKSIGVIKCRGVWKDIGTWESLCDELSDTNLGNIHINNNSGTTIINELSLPIISNGCNNLIIAASPDGILVADKKSADSIKEMVKEASLRPMYEERRWGSYRVLDYVTFNNGSSVLTKSLTLNSGKSISYQRHLHREEVWTIVDGTGEVVIEMERRNVSPGDVIVIPVGTKHALRASTKLSFIEVQRGSQLVEEDIERFQYEW